MKKSIILIIVLSEFVLFHDISAQNSYDIVRSDLDAMFANVDKTKVPTGLLLDYAVDIADIAQFNGVDLTDSNIVTIATYKDILRSLKSSYVRNNNMFGQMMNFIDNSSFPRVSNFAYVSIAAFQYNVIKANALSDNLIVYDENTNRVYDSYVDSLWQNPYETANLFAFSPMSNFSYGPDVVYRFDLQQFFKNVSVSSIQFDAGDGHGYRTIPMNSSVNVHYTSPGTKTLKMRLHTSHGELFEAHSVMHLIRSASSTQYPSIGETATEPLKQQLPVFTTIYDGVSVSAQATYVCASGRSSITKPLIFVEGFDPWELKFLFGGEDESLDVQPGFTTCDPIFVNDFKHSSLAYEYDLVYIDWNNSTEDIRANAQLLMEIIQEINDIKASTGSLEKNVVVGHSMGGLVARYALKKMEDRGIPHETAAYVSFDSPHLGANVPLGVLYFVPELFKMIHGCSSDASLSDLIIDGTLSSEEMTICNVLHSPAAKQMLVNYVGPDGTLSNNAHEEWQEELRNLGFPNGDKGEKMERLVIANGGRCDWSSFWYKKNDIDYLLYSNGYIKSSFLTDIVGFFGNILSGFIPGLIAIDIGLDFLNNAFLFLGSTTIKFNAEILPYTDKNERLSYLKLWYIKKYLWLFSKTYTIFDYEKISSYSDLYYDNFPSSYFEVGDFDNHISGDNDWGKYKFDLWVADRIPFIPTTSALCIKNGNPISYPYYEYNYYFNRPKPKVDCPFDAYFLTDIAKSHTASDGVWNWLEQQLNMDISGPDRIVSEGSYSVSGVTGNVQWSTSNSNVAEIDNTGKLIAKGIGVITVIAEFYSNGKLYRKTKDVIVNFPRLYVSARYVSGEGFRFTANTVDENAAEILFGLVADGTLLYEWTIIDQDGNATYNTSSNNATSFIPKGNEAITVAVRLVDTAGYKGLTTSITYNVRDPFALNYRYVVVNSDKNVYFVKNDGTYDVNQLNESLTIGFMYNVYNPGESFSTISLEEYIKGRVCYISYPIQGITNPSMQWMTGTKNPFKAEWIFDFFDSINFLSALSQVISFPPVNERIMYEFNMTIYNSEREPMQRTPFAIIYKPDFPSVG